MDSSETKIKIARAVFITFAITAILVFSGTLILAKSINLDSYLSVIAGRGTSKVAKLEAILNEVSNGHIDEIDKDELMEYAIKGMLNGVDDKYTYYLTAEEYQSASSSRLQNYTGIGITVDTNSKDDAVIITEIKASSSANDAGIKINDEITQVNGIQITPENKDDILATLRGEVGTAIELTIRRENETFKANVVVKSFNYPFIYYSILYENIAYVRLTSFQYNALDEFHVVLEQIKANDDITGLIFDLRGNPGGYKYVATELVGNFVHDGDVICSTQNKQGVVETDYAHGELIDIPFVVLVDGSSASASEVFAGAVQDNKTGLLIGSKTYGKGIVQFTHELDDGSYFQYTAQKWFTPNGNQIHGIGLTPDIEVELDSDVAAYIHANPDIVVSPEYDLQLAAAIDALNNDLSDK